MAWNYYNGEAYTDFTTGKFKHVPMAAAYCAACAPSHLPGWNSSAPRGQEHWRSGFKCAPWRVGRPCKACNKEL